MRTPGLDHNKMIDNLWVIACDDDIVHIDKNQKKTYPDPRRKRDVSNLEPTKPIVTK